MAGLMAAADIVISLHRSEGFGLVPAQAMALGKPVIATGWSGNLDFMNKNNSALVSYSLIPVRDPEGAFQADDQKWADANVDEAAEWLRRLAGDADLRARLGAAAAKDVRGAAFAANILPRPSRNSFEAGSAVDVVTAHRDQRPLPHPARLRRTAICHGGDQGDRRPARPRLRRAQGPRSRFLHPQGTRLSAQEHPAPAGRIFLRLCLGAI